MQTHPIVFKEDYMASLQKYFVTQTHIEQTQMVSVTCLLTICSPFPFRLMLMLLLQIFLFPSRNHSVLGIDFTSESDRTNDWQTNGTQGRVSPLFILRAFKSTYLTFVVVLFFFWSCCFYFCLFSPWRFLSKRVAGRKNRFGIRLKKFKNRFFRLTTQELLYARCKQRSSNWSIPISNILAVEKLREDSFQMKYVSIAVL